MINGASPAAKLFPAAGVDAPGGGNLKGAGDVDGCRLKAGIAKGFTGVSDFTIGGVDTAAGGVMDNGGVTGSVFVGSCPKGVLGDAGRNLNAWGGGVVAGTEGDGLDKGAPDKGELLTGLEVGRPSPKADVFVADACIGFGDSMTGAFASSAFSGDPGGVVLPLNEKEGC